MKNTLLLTAIFLLTNLAFAQKVKENDVTYTYTQLPLQPLGESVKTYSVELSSPYLPNDKAIKERAYKDFQTDSINYPNTVEKAEDDFEEALDRYESDVEMARENYKMEMEEYDKLSTFEKLAMEDHQKPKLNLPNKPIYREPNKPVYYPPNTSGILMYDPAVLANTYITLHGYNKAEDADVDIHVNLKNFEYSEPTRVTKETSYFNTKTKRTEKGHETFYETKYRHPATVKVTKDGNDIHNQMVEPANEYKEYSSKSAPNKYELEKASVGNTMVTINDYVNSEFGYAPIEVTTKVGYVKNKKGEYDDLEKALELATSAYNTSKNDREAAKTELSAAVKIWNTALAQSDVDDRKARINEKVTTMLLFNLIVANMYIDDYDASKKNLNTLNNMKLSFSERKQIEELKAQLEDRKKRHEING